MAILELPEILDLPDKMLEMVLKFNDYKYFLIEGGRGGGKTQSVARLLTYLCTQRGVRIACGREIQNSIQDSVYSVFTDIIEKYKLPFKILKNHIGYYHDTISSIKFKGFREQGRISIKGLEGVDILWIDEAEAITQKTLDVIIPTIRKENSKIICTLNRWQEADPVYASLIGRPDCLHIHINYNDNKHCPETLKKEAEMMRQRDEARYRHIWLGMPSDSDRCVAIKHQDVMKCVGLDNLHYPDTRKFITCDVASMGGDEVVIYSWENRKVINQEICTRIELMDTVGRIIAHQRRDNSNFIAVDIVGEGRGVYARLCEVYYDDPNVTIFGFDGRNKPQDQQAFHNLRAEAYFQASDIIHSYKCSVPKDNLLIQQLSNIPYKYTSSGKILLESKDKMDDSPDRADAFVMGLYVYDQVPVAKPLDRYQQRYDEMVEYDFNPATV